MRGRVIFLSFVFLIFMGCASSPINLQRETARFIGGIGQDQVEVYNIKRGLTDVHDKLSRLEKKMVLYNLKMMSKPSEK